MRVRPVYPTEHKIHDKPLKVKERPSPDGRSLDGKSVVHTRASCERKVGYATEREAWFVPRLMNRSGKNCKGRAVYQCAWCGFWKIGKKPEAK